MSQISTSAAASSQSSRFQAIFQAAVKSYQKQTKKDLIAHPLASQLQSCDSTAAILAILKDQVREFDKSHSGDERLTKWMGPTVNVLVAFSATVSGGVGLVFSPATVIFAGIGAAQDVAASKDVLAELFERIGCFFARLDTYTKVAPTSAMTDIITEIMVEVLRIFGIATKELKRGSAKKFLRKLAGMADLEGALKRLDRLTQEEARMALAEILKITHNIRDEVKEVDAKVDSVEDKVDDIGDKVAGVGKEVAGVGKEVADVGDKMEDLGDTLEDIDDKVEDVRNQVEDVRDHMEDVRDQVEDVRDQVEDVRDQVEDVRDKVEDVRDKVKDISDQVEDIGIQVEDIGNKVEDIGDKVQCVDKKLQVVINDGKQARVETQEAKLIIKQTANLIDEVKWNQLKQLLRAWLSPADPSINHNIAQKAQLKGSAVWLFQGNIIIEWKSTGSLLWVYGKPGSGKSVICSSIVEDIMAICETGSAIMAYFYFDFKDLDKQTCHHLLLSLVSQLSTRSSSCCDILHRVYETHEKGTRQPSDDTLKGCLKEMLRLPGQGPIYIILDALDECPDSSGIPSPRDEVLQLVQELVGLHLQDLHICATSRPEVDIRAVIEPLAFRSVSLHDESGQKADIADYVRTVVNLSPSMAMKRWRDDDKNLVIETLTERADGMFRWVFCQLETLRHCFPPNLRQFLNELPDTLDETYERILRGINKAQKEDARRLLQCLTVAARPLRVEELAELLAFDFRATNERGVPTLMGNWRWSDQEGAVLSTCSSLIAIVRDGGSRVVQFSHFSVKEYLTSPRLAQSSGDVSRFHVHLNAAHTILAQACLGTLLRLDEDTESDDAEWSPLVQYAAEHWVEHAQFKNVSSRIEDGMDDLFDSSKPHFAAWLRVHDVDKSWGSFSDGMRHGVISPLYYAALCGFYDLVGRLIEKHPEQRQRKCLHEHWKNCHDYPEAHTWEARDQKDIEEEEAVRALVAAEDDSYLAYDEACRVRQLTPSASVKGVFATDYKTKVIGKYEDAVQMPYMMGQSTPTTSMSHQTRSGQEVKMVSRTPRRSTRVEEAELFENWWAEIAADLKEEETFSKEDLSNLRRSLELWQSAVEVSRFDMFRTVHHHHYEVSEFGTLTIRL
ncbi:hypothetical protein EI94DRAFT_1816112 [Lactarius quietus]|nr:hypothetical protein EI94DRAFT_1816112 [Lactarius quietus]